MRRLLLTDVVARERLQAAPWIIWMQQVVPFSMTVCVAGSVGTWLAEYDVHRTRPLWNPSDIDVFVMVNTPMQYESLCTVFVDTFAMRMAQSAGSPPCRISVHRKHCHICNVRWWVTWNGTEMMCPEISLIYSPNMQRSYILLEQFDIDICRVEVHVRAGTLCLSLKSDVLAQIRAKRMHCVVTPMHAMSVIYPLQKTFARIVKYSERGYVWGSLQFLNHSSGLHVADLAEFLRRVSSLIPLCWQLTPITRSIHRAWMMYSRHQSCRPITAPRM